MRLWMVFLNPSDLKDTERYMCLLVLILSLPVYHVWKLQMPTKRKLCVIGIFLLGGLVTITGIIRLYYIQQTYALFRHPLWDDVTCMSSREVNPRKLKAKES